MKKITTYLLRIAAAMMLCCAMASCQADDLADDGEGTLPPGRHPLSFVATVGSMNSRSAGKNAWEEDDQIGVRTINLKGRKYSMIGCYSLNDEGMMKDIVKRYSVGGDGAWNELDEEPLEWPYPTGKVSAWYPFNPQVDVAIDNQAERGFDHLDFLSVITDEKSYKEVVDLEFQHRMAKVTCRVIPDDGITPDEFETLWLRLQGHTSCTFRETELTGGENIGWIIPDSTYNYADGTLYEALLVPNDMDGKDLISIGLNTKYEDHIIPKYFTYPSPVIEGGKHYTYNITVKKDRIEVTFFTAEWKDEGAPQHEPTRFTFRVNLTDNLVNVINISRNGTNAINTNLVKLSDNVTPILNTETQLYDKFDVLGNEFTISIGANTETRSKNLVLKKNEAVNNPRVVNQALGNTVSYVENKVFLIADETTLGYEDELNVGDYFFSDGSWSSVLGWSDVHCVGIVFAVNQSKDLSVFKLTDGGDDIDKAEDYNYNGPNTNGAVNPIFTSNRIRGYVLALEDAKRLDYKPVTKTLKKDDEYPAGTLEYDTQVVVTGATLNYSRGTGYPAGTLPYDVKIVTGKDTVSYKKGTDYPAGSLARDATVLVIPDTTIYAKGTTYAGGKLITTLTVTYLNVPHLIVNFPWGALSSGTQYYGEMCSLSKDLFNGFTNMISAKSNEGKHLGSQNVPPFNELEAFAAAEGFDGFVEAPEGTSGWYLPSIKQLQTALGYIHTFTTHELDSPILKAGGKTPNGNYWSSTIATLSGNTAPGNKACYFSFQSNNISSVEIVKSQTYPVRAVLTF